MDEEGRDEDGKYSETYADSEFLDAIENLPVSSTQLVAEEVGCSYDLAYRRLNSLYESSQIKRKEVGSSFVYYIPE